MKFINWERKGNFFQSHLCLIMCRYA